MNQVGGRTNVENELLCRFTFPERPGTLMKFLDAFSPRWNITLFHYRSQVLILPPNSCLILIVQTSFSPSSSTFYQLSCSKGPMIHPFLFQIQSGLFFFIIFLHWLVFLISSPHRILFHFVSSLTSFQLPNLN